MKKLVIKGLIFATVLGLVGLNGYQFKKIKQLKVQVAEEQATLEYFTMVCKAIINYTNERCNHGNK